LGEFSPNGSLFTLDSFFTIETAHIVGLPFGLPRDTYALNWTKRGVGIHFERFLTKTHLVNLLESWTFFEFSYFLQRLPGVGSEPGSSQFHLFSHFHHITAEPQRLPSFPICSDFGLNERPLQVAVDTENDFAARIFDAHAQLPTYPGAG
jgi:hypothetical protein